MRCLLDQLLTDREPPEAVERALSIVANAHRA